MLTAEYYVIDSTKDSASFTWDQKTGEFGKGHPVNVAQPVQLRLAEPIPAQPEFLDYHEAPDPVFSQPVAQRLESLDIYGIQIVPAQVRDPRGKLTTKEDYRLIHVWNRIQCVDVDQSDLEFSKSGRTLFGIDKLVLNDEVLQYFDLSKRLIFELRESVSVKLMHESVVESILATNPTGVRFFKASEWNSDMTFA